MEIISFIVLILLSLVGYSAGAAWKAGKSVRLKPQLTDLILISVIWGVAIYSRIVIDLNKWLLILIWIIISSLIGMVAIWPRKLLELEASSRTQSITTPRNLFQRIWQSWGSFSQRIGNFQSGIVLSLFFFTVITPFAVAIKMFSDPLGIRYRGIKSYWLPKIRAENSLEQFRRQF